MSMSKNLGRLTMSHLIDKYGWAVSWTSDLTEHLTVNSRTKVVKMYEHKICLLHHFEFGHECPIPQEAIKEALDTLNLLFPSEDVPTQRYLEDEGRPFHLLGSCNREDHRDLAHYRYWHKGLGRLLSVIDEEPPGLQQFVLDREHRNFREVTTFWLAVVVIIFLLSVLVSSRLSLRPRHIKWLLCSIISNSPRLALCQGRLRLCHDIAYDANVLPQPIGVHHALNQLNGRFIGCTRPFIDRVNSTN
ncbi:hypothetical protein F4824DRAFT_133600 [Ustulina deusta]|nr:hypothetical protein F4824DRAFT_133600 [Ustulina deusta]